MNYRGILAIYNFEMARAVRTIGGTIISPVISTSLYFIVFGSAMGNRIGNIDGVHYGAFIVPGMIILNLLSQSISNASFGIYYPRFTGTIYEVLSAPLSYIEITIGYVGAAATKSIILAVIIIFTSAFFTPLNIQHPIWMVFFVIMTSITFSLIGFIIGILADGFDKLHIIPLVVVTPLTFLGGSFYSIKMLPEFWQNVSLINPVVYLVSALRWSFYESADVSPVVSAGMIMGFLVISIAVIAWVFKTGYGLKK